MTDQAQGPLAAFDAAPRWDPPGDAANNVQAVAQVHRFQLVRVRNLEIAFRGRYYVKGLLQSTALHLIWGPPKCGKSFLTLDLVAHVACGISYRGLKVRQAPVVYIAAEGVEGFKARAKAWCHEHLPSDADPALYVLGMRVDLVADHKALIASIKAQLSTEMAPGITVIDTLNRTMAGSESSDEDMTAYIAAADAIKEAFGCAVIIVHHCGHEASRPRGHTALAGAVDVQISVKKDEATKVITAEVDFAKDMPDGFSTASKLRVVQIGIDEDGDPIETCIIEPTDEKPAEKREKSKLSAPQQIALIALTQAVADAGEIPPPNTHVPTNVRAVGFELWRDMAYKRGISDGEQHAKNAAFNRASKALIAAGKVGVWNDRVWPVRQS